MNDIAELTLRINSLEAKVAKQDLENLSKSGKETSQSAALLENAFAKLMRILGPAALGAAFKAAVGSAIHLGDSYVRLSEIAGTTAERMAAFDLSARLSGTTLDTVAMSVARLSRAVADAQLGDVQKQGIFRALGINPDDGKDSAERLIEVSRALMRMKDANLQAFVSQELLSRGFAEMRPFMREIVEQGTLVARTTNEQAVRMKELADSLEKARFEWDQVKLSVVEKLLPALEDLIRILQEVAQNEEMVRSFANGVIIVFQTLVVLGSDLVFIFRSFALAAAATVEQLDALKSLDFTRFRQVRENFFKDWAAMRKELDEFQERIMNLGKGAGDSGDGVLRITITGGSEGGAKGGGRSGPSEEERRLREMMEFNKTYDARIAAEKGFAERYADAIKTSNALAQEARKQGLMSEEALVRQLADNEKARLQVLVISLENQKKLHERKGETGRAAEAQLEIERANAAIVASEAIAGAQIATITSEKIKDYERWRQSVLETGQAVADSLLSEQEIQARAHEEHKAALEVYISENIDQITNAQELREALEIQHQAKLGNLQAQGQQQRMKLEKMSMRQQAEFYFGELEKITAAGAQHNKTLFQLNKAAAMANTVMSTYAGAAKALEWGWPMGPIFAGIIVAAGLANLAQIASTQFGSTTSAPSIGGGTAVPVTPASTTGQQERQEPRTTVIQFQGNITQTEADFARRLFATLNEQGVDGMRFDLQETT